CGSGSAHRSDRLGMAEPVVENQSPARPRLVPAAHLGRRPGTGGEPDRAASAGAPPLPVPAGSERSESTDLHRDEAALPLLVGSALCDPPGLSLCGSGERELRAAFSILPIVARGLAAGARRPRQSGGTVCPGMAFPHAGSLGSPPNRFAPAS